ncbi:MAG TPA: hypothetical protein VLT83_02140 [Opitutaceae bacterium]|nr:hypothetical protein [Opitutaceae bacterium]
MTARCLAGLLLLARSREGREALINRKGPIGGNSLRKTAPFIMKAFGDRKAGQDHR